MLVFAGLNMKVLLQVEELESAMKRFQLGRMQVLAVLKVNQCLNGKVKDDL